MAAYQAVPAMFDQAVMDIGESLQEALHRVADPIFIVDSEAVIRFRNVAADRILRTKSGPNSKAGRLSLGASQADAQLHSLLNPGLQSLARAASDCRALRLPRRGNTRAWLVLVSPLRLRDDDPPIFLVQLVGRLYPRNLPAAALKDLFGLSKREIEVIAAMMRHDSLHAVASRMTLSHQTVRSHLKRIFRKCDVRSQVELVAILQRISVFVNLDV